MADQLQFGFPSSPVDEATESLLRLLDGDPVHAKDRRRIVAAIVQSAREHGGTVDPNDVRKRLGGQVFPRLVGAVYQGLARRGFLVVDGWVVNDDKAGRNTGKPARRYRLRGAPPSVGGAA